MLPGRGSALCAGTTRRNRPCCDWEIEGIGYCLHHVPDELLEQAELVVGFRLCRREPGCRGYAISWSNPPACKAHLSGLARRIEYRQYRLDLIETRRAELMGAWMALRAGDRSPETLHVLGLDA
jgi:hypothetical protein